MKKYIKISIAAIIALIILVIITSVVFKIPTIGRVHGIENEKITIDGLTYIQNTSSGYSYADKGRFLGYVTNDKTTIRVYDVKGDNDDCIYALWEWEGSIYECDETKTNASESVLKEPPLLTVVCGKESVEALRGTTSWRYEKEDGTVEAVESDSMHPLQAQDYMTPLKLVPTPYSSTWPLKAYLQWEVLPDTVSVRCWDEAYIGHIDAPWEEIPVEQDEESYRLDLKEENYIYEVIAEWNDENFSGKAHYSFRIASFYSMDIKDVEPIPQSNP